MFNRFERTIAFRYLRSRKKQGFISIIAGFSFLGITLGVATLIVVMAVMNGFHQELLSRILGLNSHLSISHKTGYIRDYDFLAKNLSSLPNVVTASPVVIGQALASANGTHTGAMVRGMKAKDLQNKALIADNITMGSFWNEADDKSRLNSVIIGSKMARSMRLLPGDTIQLISPQTTSTFFGEIPRIKDYKVAGIFEVGMIEYDSSTIFMPIDAAQIYFKSKQAATVIEIDLRDIEQIDVSTKDIQNRFSNDYYITDWKESKSQFFNALTVERNVMFLILTLIIAIAAFNVVASMVMLVNSKSKEVAILRTVGASRGSIMRIFILCGASIGFVGTFAGTMLGLGFALNIESIRLWLEASLGAKLFPEEIYFLSQLPADVQNGDVYQVIMTSLILCFVATIYPAWRAAKISPIEGLKDE
jgi:lipoprotein-releasing system permease protein